MKSACVAAEGFDLISDALPFGRLWYGELDAVSYAKLFISSHAAVIHVYDKAGNVVETREQVGDFETSPPASRATYLLDILGYKTRLADVSYAKTTLKARKSLMT